MGNINDQQELEEVEEFDFTGYITEIDNVNILIVGDKFDYEKSYVDAVIIKVFRSQEIYSKLKVGTKVGVVYEGPMLDSYPGQGGAKIVKVFPSIVTDSKLTEDEVIEEVLKSINNIRDNEFHHSVYSIPSVNYKDAFWDITLIDALWSDADGIITYKMKVDDSTLNITEVIDE